MCNIKKIFSVLIVIMLSIAAAAQPGGGGGGGGFGGGGGGFGGGGGGRGGGGGMPMGGDFGGGGRGGGMGGRGGNFGGGFGGWGASVINDSTALERTSANLTFVEGRGAGNAIRDDELKQILDSVQFEKFEAARKYFIESDNRETIGTILMVPTAILTLIAATHRSEDDPQLSNDLYIISGWLAIPALSFYISGRINRGKAKLAIEKIADDYNKELEIRQAAKLLQFEFEPTVLVPYDSSPGLGLTVSLKF